MHPILEVLEHLSRHPASCGNLLVLGLAGSRTQVLSQILVSKNLKKVSKLSSKIP